MKIINQAVKKIPDGPINVDDRSIIMPAKSCVYGGIEGMMKRMVPEVQKVVSEMG